MWFPHPIALLPVTRSSSRSQSRTGSTSMSLRLDKCTQINSITCQQIGTHQNGYTNFVVWKILFSPEDIRFFYRLRNSTSNWWEKETRRDGSMTHNTHNLNPNENKSKRPHFLKTCRLSGPGSRTGKIQPAWNTATRIGGTIHPTNPTFFADFWSWHSFCRSFLVWWRLGLTGWLFLISSTWNITKSSGSTSCLQAGRWGSEFGDSQSVGKPSFCRRFFVVFCARNKRVHWKKQVLMWKVLANH